jgi:hypothetical protein
MITNGVWMEMIAKQILARDAGTGSTPESRFHIHYGLSKSAGLDL